MHKKDDIIEIINYETCGAACLPYYDIRHLHYRIIKVTEVYTNTEVREYQAELVYDTKNKGTSYIPNLPTLPFYSDFITEEGVWYSGEKADDWVKAFSLNGLFLRLSEKMKTDIHKEIIYENFLDILSLITSYREDYTVLAEEGI